MYEVTSPTNSGRVIAVWSPVSRQGAVSTTAALLASYIAKRNPKERILVLSNETNGIPTAANYLRRERLVNGLAEVIELAISDNLRSPEDLYNNAFSIENNIDALVCSKGNTNVADFLPSQIKKILELARRSYKYVIVDTVYGQFDASTESILRLSECVVVGMPQDRYIFEGWIRKIPDIYPKYLIPEKTVICCSLYYDYSHMNYTDMKRELKGSKLYYVSQNSDVHKSIGTRNILDFIGKELKKLKGRDEVVDEIEIIYERIDEIMAKIVEAEMAREAELSRQREEANQRYIDSEDMYNGMYATEDSMQQDSGYGPGDFGYGPEMYGASPVEQEQPQDIGYQDDSQQGMQGMGDMYGQDQSDVQPGMMDDYSDTGVDQYQPDGYDQYGTQDIQGGIEDIPINMDEQYEQTEQVEQQAEQDEQVEFDLGQPSDTAGSSIDLTKQADEESVDSF